MTSQLLSPDLLPGMHPGRRAILDPAPHRAHRRTGLATLTRVELRKLVDTRPGLWLHVTVALLSAGAMTAVLASPTQMHTGTHFLSMGAVVAALLLPVTGILAMTTEWSNGSVMTTFALTPRRTRIVVAKAAALLTTSLVSVGVLIALAWLTSWLTHTVGDGPADHWDVDAAHVATVALGVVLSMLMGVAFGAMFMSPAVSIVVYLVLPVAWSLLGATVESLADAATWLDTSQTFTPLLEGSIETAEQWRHVAVSSLAWVIAPLGIGLVRLARREIR